MKEIKKIIVEEVFQSDEIEKRKQTINVLLIKLIKSENSDKIA